MPHYKSQSLRLKLVAEDEDFWELVKCESIPGDQKVEDPDEERQSDVAWAREEFNCTGIDMILDKDDLLRSCKMLEVIGHMWSEGPDWDGDYDGGFEVEKIISKESRE